MKMSNYSMKELLPIVAQLTEKYTSKESTSITYEAARQLMDAVLYCIHEYEVTTKDSELIVIEAVLAKDAYQLGYQRVLDKVNRTRLLFNECIVDFCAYGNENYQDTFVKGIVGFFQFYNPLLCPQDTIITMDYPTILPIASQVGIDAIETYVQFITLEQQFFGQLPQQYIYNVLYSYQKNYHKQFYNIASIVLRNILGRILAGQNLTTADCTVNTEKLTKNISKLTIEDLQKALSTILERLIDETYPGNTPLFNYLSGDLKDFSFELRNAVEHNCLSRIFRLFS